MIIKKYIKQIIKKQFWRTLITNAFSSFIGETTSSVLNLISVILLVKILGNNSYTIFVLAQSYMTIIDSLVNFQSWQAVIKFGSEAIACHDYKKLSSLIKIGVIVDFSTAVLGVIASFAILPIVAHFFKWDNILITCAMLFSCEIIFHFSGTSTGILRLFNKFNMVAIQKITVATVKLFLIFLIYLLNVKSLLFVVGSYVCVDILGHILLTTFCTYVIVKSNQITLKDIFHSDISEYNKTFWKFVFWTNVTSSIDIPAKQFDVFIISTFSYELVAVFKVYKQIGAFLLQLSTPISQAILPQFSDLVARGKQKECYNVVLKIRNTILGVMLPISIIITIISPYALKIIFSEIHARYFYILSLYLLIRTYALSYTAIHPLFISLGYVKENFKLALLANFVYVAMALILSKYMSLMGIIISLFIEYFIIISVKGYIIKKRAVEISLQ